MKILLISGHGNGDPGACYNGYQEAIETRKVATALGLELQKRGITVAHYPMSRNAYTDYQNGSLLKTANVKQYDYALEIHFNACTPDKGDGKTKGVECYVTTAEKGTAVETAICKRVSALGLTNRGVKAYNWAVINTLKKQGVSSALLEVCFIDDNDDMQIYLRSVDNVAKAIADGICDGFGVDFKQVELQKESVLMEVRTYNSVADMPSWAKDTVVKLIKKKYLVGDGRIKDKDGYPADLNLSYDLLRMLVVNDRAGLYK